MENLKENVANTATEVDDNVKAINAIQHIPSDVVLRNLAFWFDVAMAKGRYIDMMEQDAMSKANKDKE